MPGLGCGWPQSCCLQWKLATTYAQESFCPWLFAVAPTNSSTRYRASLRSGNLLIHWTNKMKSQPGKAIVAGSPAVGVSCWRLADGSASLSWLRLPEFVEPSGSVPPACSQEDEHQVSQHELAGQVCRSRMGQFDFAMLRVQLNSLTQA